MAKCVICQGPIAGSNHNAAPVRAGRCCDGCNTMYVMDARMILLSYKNWSLGFSPVWDEFIDDFEQLAYRAEDINNA